ncbi:MAG: type III PLP-dependent enzyme [Alphaproteobacteria bacterium]|nr:type III PLP-dependent enzyme [Alphaproteobacteria bacterium]MBU0797624.1 type III PLP-dependent enzyme [Alphaproteobacteria bacterium]MBU0889130.1 type III PLP-dependent enzyme [Alphaproteobacteria bacterium]MBU1812164.1 type III PLP-dependent enzyme [Alphaproteobacteria bacterium]MBU2090177.1 type III PLP-dependent enzyme [Alphaproteobacteria bacterium]
MAHTLDVLSDFAVRRRATKARTGTGRLPSVDGVVAALKPSDPLVCLRPHLLEATARSFVSVFPGRVFYAVKCNPDTAVLRALAAGGVQHFDVASLTEIETVHRLLPDARMAFMHPVKPRASIREAYAKYGVRDFALDSVDELAKIITETGHAADLGLFVRLKLPKGNAVYDLSGKFGAAPEQAITLLRAARDAGKRVGLCFHVGSQCLDPTAYERALDLAGEIIRASGVTPDVLDIGGGFPVSYPDATPPALWEFMTAISRGFRRLNLPKCELWCEPGRALVAAGASLVVQVHLRRGNELFINDGVYGTLSDAGVPAFRFPVRLIRPGGENVSEEMQDYVFFGPTCDSADRMAGPFPLPADMREGDWIEIGQLGAYGACLRTGFNGFDRIGRQVVADGPLLATPGHPGAGEEAARFAAPLHVANSRRSKLRVAA